MDPNNPLAWQGLAELYAETGLRGVMARGTVLKRHIHCQLCTTSLDTWRQGLRMLGVSILNASASY